MKLKFPTTKNFLRCFTSIASTVSKQDSRPILQTVNLVIDFELKTLTMMATDSAILTVRTDDLTSDVVENPEKYKKLELNVPAEDFIKTLKAFTPKKGDCYMEIVYEADKDVNSIEVILNETSRFKIRLAYGDYPRLDGVLNGYQERLSNYKDYRIVCLNTELLKELVKYAETMGTAEVKFALPGTPGEHLKPIPFCLNESCGNTYGIITPMRPY